MQSLLLPFFFPSHARLLFDNYIAQRLIPSQFKWNVDRRNYLLRLGSSNLANNKLVHIVLL